MNCILHLLWGCNSKNLNGKLVINTVDCIIFLCCAHAPSPVSQEKKLMEKHQTESSNNQPTAAIDVMKARESPHRSKFHKALKELFVHWLNDMHREVMRFSQFFRAGKVLDAVCENSVPLPFLALWILRRH